MIEFIDSNKNNHNVKTMSTVLGVVRSTYYKYFNKTKSIIVLESEELKDAIKRIYKENKGIYGAPRIHHILCMEGVKVSLKRDFTTTSINEKWVGDTTYIHTIKDGWCYLASVLDLHYKKIIGYAFGKKMTNDLVINSLKNAY